MHHGGDYSQYYHPTNPNPSLSYPNPPPIHTEFASAPPYSTNPYPTPNPNPNPNPNHRHPSDFPNYPSPYPLQAPDPAIIMPPSAPSYSPHPQLSLPFPQDPSPYPHQFSQPPFYNPAPAPISHPSYDSGPAAGYGYGVDEGMGDGVYAYDGGKTEPYGARGIGGFSGPKGLDSGLKFDDYGRSIGGGGGGGSAAGPKEVATKVVRAVPKMESQQDVKNGVQKFRVKLLPEGASVTTTDVLCQVRNGK